jgi:AcrR family transcriptional regulator
MKLLKTTEQRREGRRSQHRQKILHAALQIITKEGFAALSMRKLADRIEYSPASIYLYFKNREQLAQELSEAGFRELLQAIPPVPAAAGWVEALHALGAAYVAWGIRNPEMYRLIFMGDADFTMAAFEKQDEDSAGMRAWAVLLDIAARIQREGFMKHAANAELAELIWMTLHGIVSLHITCVRMQLSPPEKLVKLATRTLAAGFRCDAPKLSSRSASARGGRSR